MRDQECCYYRCPEPGTIHIGANGGDSHWICFRHLDAWREDRARFLAHGLPCEMEELGELVCPEHFSRYGFCDLPHCPPSRDSELALTRLLAVEIDVILNTSESDLKIRIDAAKDVVREFKHLYPETSEI